MCLFQIGRVVLVCLRLYLCLCLQEHYSIVKLFVSVACSGVVRLIVCLSVASSGVVRLIVCLSVASSGVVRLIVCLSVASSGVVRLIVCLSVASSGVVRLIVCLYVASSGVVRLIVSMAVLFVVNSWSFVNVHKRVVSFICKRIHRQPQFASRVGPV